MNKQIKETHKQEKPMENLQRLSWKSKMCLTQQLIQIMILIAKSTRQDRIKKK